MGLSRIGSSPAPVVFGFFLLRPLSIALSIYDILIFPDRLCSNPHPPDSAAACPFSLFSASPSG
jgi:hypothetical protein